MTVDVVERLVTQSSKSRQEVEQILSEVRTNALARFKTKNDSYRDYVARVTKRRLGIAKQPTFKGK